MSKTCILFFILFFGGIARAQEVVLNNTLSDTTQKKQGPNLKVFRQVWVQTSFFTPYENNSLQKFPASYHVGFGYRVKYKLNKTFSWGWGLSYQYNHHRLNSFLIFPTYNLQNVTKQKLLQRQLGGELFYRTNFGNRGNIIGRFVDVGITGGLNIVNTFRYVLDEKDQQGKKIGETTINTRKTGKTLPYYYGLTGRIGINRIALTGEFRLSRIFKTSENLPELSPLRVGLQLAI